jgi:hypothetical protein
VRGGTTSALATRAETGDRALRNVKGIATLVLQQVLGADRLCSTDILLTCSATDCPPAPGELRRQERVLGGRSQRLAVRLPTRADEAVCLAMLTMANPKPPPGPGMTLGNMRGLGVGAANRVVPQ